MKSKFVMFGTMLLFLMILSAFAPTELNPVFLTATVTKTVHMNSYTNASPTNGDMWTEGGVFKFQAGGKTHAFSSQQDSLAYFAILIRSGIDSIFYSYPSMTATGHVTVQWETNKSYFGSLSAYPMAGGFIVYLTDIQPVDSINAVATIYKTQ